MRPPSISYASGELKFASETAGAEYHYTITDADKASDAYSKDGKVTLSVAYKISVYATADGHTASDKASNVNCSLFFPFLYTFLRIIKKSYTS